MASERNLRKTILLPLSLTWFLLLGIFHIALYQTQSTFLNRELATAQRTAQAFLGRVLDSESARLIPLVALVGQDHAVQVALRQGNRHALAEKASEIVKGKPENSEIIHVHFYSPDLVPVLEYHHVSRSDENQGTAILRRAKASGRPAYGLDLDPLGTLTFWMAAPCLGPRHQLLGYLLLGENFFAPAESGAKLPAGFSTRIDSILLLEKQFLVRDRWEAGMRLSGHSPHWEQLSREVVVSQSFGPGADDATTALLSRQSVSPTRVKLLGRSYLVTSHPLRDEQQRQVGRIVLFVDISDSVTTFQRTMVTVLGLTLLLGASLVLFTSFLLKKAELRLAAAQQRIVDQCEANTTAQEEHGRELRKAWLYLQNIIECIGDPLMVVDRDYRIMLANRAVHDAIDAAELRPSTKHCWDIFPAGGRTPATACTPQCRGKGCPVQQVFNQRTMSELTHTVRQANGGTFISRTLAWPVLDEAGEVAQVALVFHDITSLKETEEQLRWESAVNLALAEMAKAFITHGMTIETISAIVLAQIRKITASEHGFVGYIEPATGHLLCPDLPSEVTENNQVADQKVRFEELRGLWGWILDHREPLLIDDPSLAPRASGLPASHVAITSFLAVPAIIEDELVGVIALANAGQPYGAREQQTLEQFAVLYAIAIQRQRWEEELARSREEAITANRGKDQFIANMSHELRTPLNGILGMTNLLLATDHTEQQQKYLEMSKNSATALLRIINDILDHSKVAANRLTVEEIPFDPRTLLRQVIDIFTLEAKSKGLSLDCHVADQVPALLRGDPGRVRQILVNLIGNALKFTEQGGITVTARCRPDDQEAVTEAPRTVLVEFVVQDSGIGIPADQLSLLFTDFTQLDGSLTRKYGGTGLGLSFSRKLAERMGGGIEVRSEAEEGSTFTCVLPFPVAEAEKVAAGAAAEGPAATAERQETAGEGRSGVIRILLAEDDLVSREVAMEYLRRPNWWVTAVHDGQAALEAFRDNSFDLVLMDLQMPRMDGLEATAQIREYERRIGTHRTPVIALTAHTMGGYRERCLKAGMDDFLSKPLTPEALLAILERYIAVVPPARAPDEKIKEAAPIDLTLIRKALRGNTELFAKLVDHFTASGPQQMADLKRHLAAEDGEGLRAVAHTLKGTLANFGAAAASALAAKLEKMGRDRDLAEAAGVFAELEAALTTVMAALAQARDQPE